ncbi:MAG: phosphatidate cytidylyltransferase [Anaerolineaceae bacterium]|nr:phosphatidate cytidylyltransferase [Anaerolineaceae bacterium]
MKKQRLITGIILLLIVAVIIWLGGWYFNALILWAMAAAGWEWAGMFQKDGYQPAKLLVAAGIIGFVLTRIFFQFAYADLMLVAILLINLFYYVYRFEIGSKRSGFDFIISLSGICYIGWLGAYMISVRSLPNGLYWLFLLVLATAAGDSGAYFVGGRWGKHKMSPRVSPNKTWEGYAAGMVSAALFALIFSAIFYPMMILKSTVFAFAIYTIIPIGDFGVSLIKRQLGVKDTGNLLPGHGGVLDRIDTHLWTVSLGYYIIIYLF